MTTLAGQTAEPWTTPAYQYITDTDDLPLIERTPPWPLCRVKLFNPSGAGTWFIAGYDPDTRIAFGIADIQERELGSFSLDEIIEYRSPIGLPIERDLYWTPTPSKDLMDDPFRVIT